MTDAALRKWVGDVLLWGQYHSSIDAIDFMIVLGCWLQQRKQNPAIQLLFILTLVFFILT
jgi:hypothetical protein